MPSAFKQMFLLKMPAKRGIIDRAEIKTGLPENVI
jgi:hypothetical protein